MRRIAVAVLVAATALLVNPAPAFAHTRLLSSDPAEGATLTVAPQQIRLTFTDQMSAPLSKIAVNGPDGTQWEVGPLAAENTVVTAPVRQTGPAGKHTITYRVLSGDGHPVSGTVRFTLDLPAPTSSTVVPTTSSTPLTTTQTSEAPAGRTDAGETPADTGTPVWPWVIGAVALVAILGLLAARLRRGRPEQS